MNDFEFELSSTKVEELQTFSQLLNKDINTMLNEALELYFQTKQKELLEKDIENDNMMTNLDYDEFWDGVELD